MVDGAVGGVVAPHGRGDLSTAIATKGRQRHRKAGATQRSQHRGNAAKSRESTHQLPPVQAHFFGLPGPKEEWSVTFGC